MSRSTRLATALALIGLVSCSRDQGTKRGPLLARGKGVAVTTQELQAKLDEQPPYIRARYASTERKKELLENLIRFELLAAEAERQKLDQDPEVRETMRKAMVQRLVRKAFDEEAQKPAAEGDARAYYDAHRDEFVKPERLRLSQIFLRAPRGSPERAAKQALAARLAARVRAEGAKSQLAFADAARDASEDAGSKASGGDLGYLTHDEIATQLSAPALEAVRALRNAGDETGVVEAEDGFRLLKLTARQAGLDRPFDEVKAQLAARLAREQRTQDFDAFVKKLRASADVTIDDAELAKVGVGGAALPAAGAAEPGRIER